MTTKLCGNCSGNHKYEDCPTIDLQFPPTKKEYAKLKEDSEQWKIYLDGGMNNLFEIHERIEKRVKELRYELDHTNPDYKRSLALQEALQEMVNLIGFEKYEEIMVGKK